MENIPCSWIRRFNIVKVSILSNLIYGFNAISIKFPGSYFVDMNKLILKLTWRGKKTQNRQHNLENKVEGLTLATSRLTIKLY